MGTDGLSRALHFAGRFGEAFEAVVVALEVHANMDAIHPTPIYELLHRAEMLADGRMADFDADQRWDEDGEEVESESSTECAAGVSPTGRWHDSQIDLRRIMPSMETSQSNLAKRGLDTDGNGGMVLQKMGQILLTCAQAEKIDGNDEVADQLRARASQLLHRARDLMLKATEVGEADLSELCVIAAMQIGLSEAHGN